MEIDTLVKLINQPKTKKPKKAKKKSPYNMKQVDDLMDTDNMDLSIEAKGSNQDIYEGNI